MDSIIQIKNLTKNFGREQILDQINLNISRGKIIGLTGESGTGKTTLINILIGFLESDEGEIFFNSKGSLLNLNDLRKDNAFYRFLGVSTQECSFYQDLSVNDNLMLYGSLNGLEKVGMNKRIDNLLNLVNLSEKKEELVSRLSSGMQKRLDIACSLIHKPKIIFLDEPTAHLDEKNREIIWSLVRKIKDEGTTVVVASHFLEELRKACDEIYLIKDKKIQNVQVY
jgi:ABC-2 type transport system ATP-binding protein